MKHHWIANGRDYVSLDEVQYGWFENGDTYGGYEDVATGTNIDILTNVQGSDGIVRLAGGRCNQGPTDYARYYNYSLFFCCNLKQSDL